jgi:hypothetical protein
MNAEGMQNIDLVCLMIAKANLMKPASKLDSLLDENNPLILLLVTSIKIARQKRPKTS